MTLASLITSSESVGEACITARMQCDISVDGRVETKMGVDAGSLSRWEMPLTAGSSDSLAPPGRNELVSSARDFHIRKSGGLGGSYESIPS